MNHTLILFCVGVCTGLAQSPGKFVATGNMSTSRADHTATLLSNGKVLIAGGYSQTIPVVTLASAELYDPSTGAFSATGDMTAARANHTATLLPDGRVLILGGRDGFDSVLDSAEIYDPSAGAFTAVSSMITPHACHRAILLGTGKILVLGGSGLHDRSPNAELYDTTTGTFKAAGAYAGDPSGNNSCQASSSALLADGRVLIVWEEAGVEVYDPSGDTFAAVKRIVDQGYNDGLPALTLLTDGMVLLTGGADDSGIRPSAEVYDPSARTFTRIRDMSTARALHSSTLLPDGTVLIAGSYRFGGGVVASAEVYDPTTGAFAATADMRMARSLHQATLLNNGQVLITGGYPLTASAELYTPQSQTPNP
jgi:hypothetical protein